MVKFIAIVAGAAGVWFGLPVLWRGSTATAFTALNIGWSYVFCLTVCVALLIGFKLQASK